MTSHMKLMIPGPVDVWDETLEALSEPVRAQYGEEWITIYRETVAMVKQVFQTKNAVVIMTASGSGALDAGIASLFSPREKVAVVNNGPFAMRLLEILKAYHIRVVSIKNEWGEAGDVDKMRDVLKRHRSLAGIAVVANDTGVGVRNPVKDYAALARELDVPIFVDGISAMGGYDVPVDKWGLDVVCTSSNKALETAPGLGVISVSDRAWEIIRAKSEKASHRGWYYDLNRWKTAIDSDPGHPYPTTQATSMIVSLYASLDRIVKGETLHGHWARYAWAQGVVRTGLKTLGFELVVPDDVASYTVTTFRTREDMRNKLELRDYLLQEQGILIATGIGQFARNVLRIGHMGRAGTRDYLVPCLLGLEEFVRSVKGEEIPHGCSLIGMKDQKRWY